MKLRLFCLPLLALTLQAQTPKLLQASGAMDVETRPDASAPADLGRFLLIKHYHGGLDADAAGEMLGGGDLKSGTAGYVALETVTGTLLTPQGARTGTFQLMHWGTMENGKLDLRVAVVPGSGTGALRGITGTLHIDRTPDGKHTYTLDYSLPQS